MELPHIGETCVICNRNDYLPFKCAHCTKIVCIDHRSDHGSDCPLSKTSFYANIKQKTSATKSIRGACDFCEKITLQLELSECLHCHAKYCLYHRHQVQHNCTKLAEDGEIRRQNEEARVVRQQEALNRLKATQPVIATREKEAPIRVSQVDPKKLALARRVTVMRIKQSARGLPNVLDQDKLFFEVEFIHNPQSRLSNESKHGKKLNIFATKAHTIGRLVDYSSHELDLKNKNHINGSDQLVFEFTRTASQDSPEIIVLDSQVTFQKYLDSGILNSGDKLMITYRP